MDDTALYYLFRGFANRERLRIIKLLAQEGEMTVSELAERIRLSQPLVSWHLARLRRARLVLTRKEGGQAFISLNEERLHEGMAMLDDWHSQAAAARMGGVRP